jgi:hypothetical protein
VVPLAVGQTEEPLLEDGILAVPQGQREAQELPVVGDPRQPILAPAVGPRTGVIVAEVVLGIARLAVVLANGAPLALREIGPPLLPWCVGMAGFLEAACFFGHRRSLQRQEIATRCAASL